MDDYITFEQAGRLLPVRRSAVTLWRWAREGFRLPSGKRVFLEYRRIGARRMFTRPAWLERFLEEIES